MATPIRSSLILQVLIYFNGWYDLLMILVMLAVYVWKGAVLPFPSEIQGLLGLEIALVFGLSLLECSRLFLGSRGNKTEEIVPLMSFSILSLMALGVNIYFMLLQ